MNARDERTNPNSCINRAKPDEMTFVLLGRDAAAPSTIRKWCALRIALGLNKSTDEQIKDAYKTALIMEEQHNGLRAVLHPSK